MGWVRVLRLLQGSNVDHTGREVGEDWLIVDLGRDEDQSGIYLTTDRVRGSDYGDLVPVTQLEIGVLLARFVNDRIEAEGMRAWGVLLSECVVEAEVLVKGQSEATQVCAKASGKTLAGALRRGS